MNSDADHRPATDHEQLLSEVAELAVDRGLDIATPERIAEFLQHYFKHADSSTLLARPAGLIAGALLHHAKLAWWRLPGESHVELFTPSLYSDGWDAGGHTVLTVVTDDKDWLVDTVTMVLARQGWAVRDLVHPQYSVLRDAGTPNFADAWLRHRGLDWAADLLPSAPSAASFLASQPLEVSP